MRQLRQELIEFLLSIGQLSAAAEVDTEAIHDAVNDEKSILIGCEIRCERVQKLELMLQDD